MSNFFGPELNANEQKPLFEIVCIEFGTRKVRRLSLVFSLVETFYSFTRNTTFAGTREARLDLFSLLGGNKKIKKVPVIHNNE